MSYENKFKVSRLKVKVRDRADVNKVKTKRTIQIINETKSWILEIITQGINLEPN